MNENSCHEKPARRNLLQGIEDYSSVNRGIIPPRGIFNMGMDPRVKPAVAEERRAKLTAHPARNKRKLARLCLRPLRPVVPAKAGTQ
jgi:hypothetical protein